MIYFRHGYGHQVTPVYHGTPTPNPFHGPSTIDPFQRDPPPPGGLLPGGPLLARDGPFFLDGAKK